MSMLPIDKLTSTNIIKSTEVTKLHLQSRGNGLAGYDLLVKLDKRKVATRLVSTSGAWPNPMRRAGMVIAKILEMRDMFSRSQPPRKLARISHEPQNNLTALIIVSFQ